ncbi:MAG: hypothetical protein JW983_06865 [Elusimicrobia bacterium]|nr:hypothetical protein [Elusimicrobiota bacterium]
MRRKINKNIFLSVLLLVLSCADVMGAGIRVRKDFSYYKVVTRRNIFRPIWDTSEVRKDDKEAKKKHREELEKAEKEKQERLEKAKQERELAAKKRELETNLVLTGIILDDNQFQAVIQNRKLNNKTFFVGKGDMIEDTEVVSIDDSKGEIVLDYKNLIKVKLYLK